MAFGKMGARGGFGSLGVLGGAGGILSRLTLAASIKQVMASPPTITTSATAFGGSLNTNWPPDNSNNANWAPVADFYGGFPARSTNRIRLRCATSNPATATNPLAVTGFDDTISRIAFKTKAAVVALFVNTSNTLPFRFLIDGQYVDLTGTVAAQTADSYIKIDFGSASAVDRTITIEGPNSWGLQRIITTSSDTVSAPGSTKPKIMVLGNSYVVGPISTQYVTPAPLNADGFVRAMGDYLGVPDIWAAGLGGTGWTVANGTKPALKDRGYDALNLMPDGTTARTSWFPDAIFAPIGLNDVAQAVASSTMASGLETFHTYVRARAPKIPVVYGGVFWKANTAGGSMAATIAAEQALQAKVAGFADHYADFMPISTAATPWITGTGYEGATNGSGNSDTMIGTDGVHPSYAGHPYIGQLAASEFLRICRSHNW